MTGNKCNAELAVLLCKRIEKECPAFGYHVALTGGCLYGEGDRKDIDIVFYSIRGEESPSVELDELFYFLETELGFQIEDKHDNERFVYRSISRGFKIDIFFPEHSGIGGYDLE